MPNNISWTDSPLLSEVLFGTTKYYMKDAEARRKIADLYDRIDASFHVEIYDVGELPTPGASYASTLGLIPKNTGSEETNYYEEYVCIEGPESTWTWEKIGDTQVDLSNYVTKSTQIAGLQIADGITANGLKGQLNLGELADYDSVPVTGTATITHTATSASVTQGKVTAAGTITGNAALVSSASSKTVSVTPASSSIAIGDVTNVTASSTVSATGAGAMKAEVPTGTETLKFSTVSSVSAVGGLNVSHNQNSTNVVTGITSASVNVNDYTLDTTKLSFTGSQVNVSAQTVSYDKANASASVSGTAAPTT